MRRRDARTSVWTQNPAPGWGFPRSSRSRACSVPAVLESGGGRGPASLALLSEGIGWAWQPRSFGRLDRCCHHRFPVVPAGSSPCVCLSALLSLPLLLTFAGCHRAASASPARPSGEKCAGKWFRHEPVIWAPRTDPGMVIAANEGLLWGSMLVFTQLVTFPGWLQASCACELGGPPAPRCLPTRDTSVWSGKHLSCWHALRRHSLQQPPLCGHLSGGGCAGRGDLAELGALPCQEPACPPAGCGGARPLR